MFLKRLTVSLNDSIIKKPTLKFQIMIFDQKFIPHLLTCLKNRDYVLFEHFTVHKPTLSIALNFLLRKKDVQEVIQEIQAFSEVGVSDCVSKTYCSEVSITFKDSNRVQLNFWHQLAKDNVNYLDVDQVFSKKQLSKSEFFMPNIEHLFEFAILSNFLNDKALAPHYQSYFEDFHFFVRDGLLDFFNEKYGTKFSNLDEMTTFQPKTKEMIIEALKRLPVNHFFKRVNISWLNFLSQSAS